MNHSASRQKNSPSFDWWRRDGRADPFAELVSEVHQEIEHQSRSQKQRIKKMLREITSPGCH